MTTDSNTDETDESGDSSAIDPSGVEDPRTDLHEREPYERDDTRAYALGGTFGALLGWFLRGLLDMTAGFVRELTTFIPYGPRMWRGIAKTAVYNYQKSMGCDAISLTYFQESIDLEPVDYKLPDDDDRPGWNVRGTDRWYNPSTGGRGVLRFGKASMKTFDVDNVNEVTPFEARYAEALDLDNVDALIAPGASLKQVIVEVFDDRDDPDAAVTDGGVRRAESEVTLDAFDELAGDVVNLSSGPGYDGMYIDPKKVKETYQETGTVEEWRRQEERGLAAVMDKSELRAFMWKVFLVGAAVAIAGLVGKELVYALFGAETINNTMPGLVSVLPSLGVI